MTRTNCIAANLGAQMMALDPVLGHSLLSMPMPTAASPVGGDLAISGTDVKVDRGTRFVEVRGVAVMPVRGILTPNSEAFERYLGWATYSGIEAVCAEVAARDDIQALVIEADSPGGLVMGQEAATTALAALARVKPEHVIVSPLAASAAYWLASQATEISAAPGSIVGSIGVMRESAWPVQPDMGGDQWGVHVSSHARSKAPNPTTEAGQRQIQRELDAAEMRFLEAVAAGRGVTVEALMAAQSSTEDQADGGGYFMPEDALARGLIDQIETRSEFYARVFGIYAPAPKKTAPARAYHAAAAAAAQAAARL
jgi:ClpP class serine protease